MTEKKYEITEERSANGQIWYYVKMNGCCDKATQSREEAEEYFKSIKKEYFEPYKKVIKSLILYKGYEITVGSPYGFEWIHPDYCGAPEYAESTPTDPRCGYGKTVEQCKEEIDECIDLLNEQND